MTLLCKQGSERRAKVGAGGPCMNLWSMKDVYTPFNSAAGVPMDLSLRSI